MSEYDTSRLQELGRRRQRLVAQLADIDQQLDAEIQAAAAGGVAQVDVIKWTGLARESVRRKSMTEAERDQLRQVRRVK
jgi:hypothetical protein